MKKLIGSVVALAVLGCIPSANAYCPVIPDTDFDGYPDTIDRCPYQPAPEYLGCPDTDGDTYPDIDDECPDVPGPFHGCPFYH